MKLPLLFAGMDPEVAKTIIAGARKRQFRRGEVVFHEGDPGDSLQVVVRGHIALRATTTDGHVYLFRVYGAGDMFGRVAVGPIDAVRVMTVVSLDDSETYEFFRAQIEDLRSTYPSMNDGLIASLARELHTSSTRLLEALYVDADRRVRRRLLELAELYCDGDADAATIPLTQADLGALAGASRATVNRVLREEERRGAVGRQRGTIVVRDHAGLARRAR